MTYYGINLSSGCVYIGGAKPPASNPDAKGYFSASGLG